MLGGTTAQQHGTAAITNYFVGLRDVSALLTRTYDNVDFFKHVNTIVIIVIIVSYVR